MKTMLMILVLGSMASWTQARSARPTVKRVVPAPKAVQTAISTARTVGNQKAVSFAMHTNNAVKVSGNQLSDTINAMVGVSQHIKTYI